MDVALDVLLDQLRLSGFGVGGLLHLAPVDDVHRLARAHHRELGRRPREGQVAADRLGVHDDVGAAVGLAGDDLDARDGGLAVGVQQLGPVADDAAVLLPGAGEEARHVDEGDQRDVEGVAGADEAPCFLGRFDVEDAGQNLGLVADDADGMAVETGEAAHDVLRPVREVLVEVAVVDDGRDDLLHVVRLAVARGEQLTCLGRLALRIVARLEPGRLLEVVGWQEREEIADLVEAGLLVRRHERGDAGLGRVSHGPAKLFEGDVLAGGRLHDIGPGDEHVRGLPDHVGEVGHGRAVDGPARARAEDHAHLGDDP